MKWNINDMPLFLAVVDTGGISAASRALDTPKSTISRSLNRLEDALSVRLLQRNSRTVRLTEEGEAFYQHCQQMQKQIESTEATINGFKQHPSGKLTISMPAGFYLQFLQPVMNEFAYKHPHIKLDIMIAAWDQDLYTNAIDVAIQFGPLPDSELIASKLINSSLIWVSSEEYYQLHKQELDNENLSIESLKKHARLMVDSRKHHSLYIQHKDEMTNLFAPPHNICNDSFAVKSAVMSGFGVSLMPEFIVQQELKAGSLRQIGKEFKIMPESSVYAVYPSRKNMAEKTKILLEFLRNSVK
ncbi:LysR family transcriptional regulator [Vibrio sp. SCSIO 43137]|uniref:LysR family transcriptional regulator n=1 Tax=Vibrio sp. SCSIO 43137 TaxID=3021011 RepID=UPI00230822CD|nr:LysR family transcriptional regulator [Vibrio sp. SCSIO 43137]WCE28814.1 LysR family transcriptional regulator [Vibrio sp. SCSIO 43137]